MGNDTLAARLAALRTAGPGCTACGFLDNIGADREMYAAAMHDRSIGLDKLRLFIAQETGERIGDHTLRRHRNERHGVGQ